MTIKNLITYETLLKRNATVPETRERERERGSFFTRIRLGRRWIWRIEKTQPRERDTLAGFPAPLLSGTRVINAYVIPVRSFLTLLLHRGREINLSRAFLKNRENLFYRARESFVKIYEREERKKRKGKRIESANWRPRSWNRIARAGKRRSKFLENGTNERTEGVRKVSRP